MLAHFLQSSGRLPYKFELNLSNTANLRSVLLEPCWKTLKNPFSRSFLAQNVFFSQNVPIFKIVALFAIKWAAIL